MRVKPRTIFQFNSEKSCASFYERRFCISQNIAAFIGKRAHRKFFSGIIKKFKSTWSFIGIDQGFPAKAS